MRKIHIGEYLREDFLLKPNQLAEIVGCTEEKAVSVLKEESELSDSELQKLEKEFDTSPGFIMKLAGR